MTESDAQRLIRDAIPADAGPWADLGAGTGTFTRALAVLIGSGGSVLAVDSDAGALKELEAAAKALQNAATIASRVADFTAPLGLSGLSGILLANALHFVPYSEQATVLRALAASLRPDGRIVVVEYDRDRGNDWVPYPVSSKAFGTLATTSGLATPTHAGQMRSSFGGELYCSWATVSDVMQTPPSHQP